MSYVWELNALTDWGNLIPLWLILMGLYAGMVAIIGGVVYTGARVIMYYIGGQYAAPGEG